ncbi:HAD-IIA family hydrolase [Pedobacter frigiditerrae]|uniref:HAD-IIA family hydrolase n=1 Tax=Pedobacter frigiditerrae TaxID=2530452 RepID=A0A4R0N0S8_9SPHI|nr:HAD-IIA family hydrolase [Pedobacter frigiditerrae]TCC91942.1 HAD-IIA family hydrolase [Pedobacter frigiditerrae]
MQEENKSYEGIISDVSPELIERLKKIKHVALDMDGTIYNGSTLFPYTPGFLQSLKSAGISYSFLTNNPSKGIGDYLKHLEKMGIPAVAEEMYTSALATIDYLKSYHPLVKRLFILGTPSMIGEFEANGFISTADDANDKPDAVVVGFDSTLVYSRLCRAAWWVSQQLPYVATNPDWVCPTDQPVILVDCGAICACIEGATKRLPDIVLGKPDPRMLDGILHRQGLQPEEIAMVGDRLYTDVKMALNANALGVLVLSGEATMEDVAASEVGADVIADNVAKFGDLLLAVQKV